MSESQLDNRSFDETGETKKKNYKSVVFFILLTVLGTMTPLLFSLFEMHSLYSSFEADVAQSKSTVSDVFRSMFVPFEFISNLAIIIALISAVTTLSLIAHVYRKKMLMISGVVIFAIFSLLSVYNATSGYDHIEDNYTVLKEVYDKTNTQMTPFDRQLYTEALSVYDGYKKDSSLENAVKFDSAYFSTVFLRDFLKDLNKDDLALFQRSLDKDIHYTVIKERMYTYISVYCVFFFIAVSLSTLYYFRLQKTKINSVQDE